MKNVSKKIFEEIKVSSLRNAEKCKPNESTYK